MYLVIGRENCSYCDKAKDLLDAKGKEYVYVDITSGDSVNDAVWKKFLTQDMEVKTVPQVFQLIGGFEELHEEIIYGY
jgi:glutaredoxin